MEYYLRIDHIPGHKTSHGKFKKTKSISSIFSDLNMIRPEITTKKTKKYKRVEIKHYATKQIMDHRTNQRGNQTISREK